jgi:hypothetical protein
MIQHNRIEDYKGKGISLPMRYLRGGSYYPSGAAQCPWAGFRTPPCPHRFSTNEEHVMEYQRERLYQAMFTPIEIIKCIITVGLIVAFEVFVLGWTTPWWQLFIAGSIGFWVGGWLYERAT